MSRVNAGASNVDLFHVLAARARTSSDGTLVLAVIIGLSIAIVVAILRVPAWLLLASVAVSVAAFGAWGIADRELTEHTGAKGRAVVYALRGVRTFAVLAGACAAMVAAFRVLSAALGTWIS